MNKLVVCPYCGKKKRYERTTAKGTLYYCHSGACGRGGFIPAGDMAPHDTLKLISQHLNKKESVDVVVEDVLLPWDYEPVIPEQYKDWLGQYGLTDEELRIHGFGSGGNRLIMPIYDEKDGSLIYYQGRGVDPKYINFKSSRKLIYGVTEPPGYVGNTITIVEDIISMIKVGRTRRCLALLGSVIPDALLPTLAQWNNIEVWLDYDKADYSKRMSRRIKSLTGKNAFSTITILDPKEYIV